MNLLTVLLLLFFGFGIATRTQTQGDELPSRPPQTIRVDKKLEREIRAAEDRLRLAIQKSDPALLDLVLADYYADSSEGSDRAIGKETTLAKCKSGTLHFYQIKKDRKLTTRAELVQVAGAASEEEGKPQSDKDTAANVYVTRLWTKKDGRWQLISQTLRPLEKEAKQ
jgi:hypothetical protein